MGCLVSANKLTGLFGTRSSATLLEYFSYFKDAYLMELLPRFSYSMKVQARNPKKVYAIDTGLITAASTAFTDNSGHRLENLVYLLEAMKFFDLTEGIIVTLNQKDRFEEGKYTVELVPAQAFMTPALPL